MTLTLLAGAQLIAVSFCCPSPASSEGEFKDMTLLNSHFEAIQARSSVDPLAAKDPRRTPDAFALTPAELRLAIQRKQNLEEARDVNAAAHRVAVEFENEITALDGEATHEGVLLRFGDASFSKDTTQLNSVSRDRLARLVVFLRSYPEQVLKIEKSSQDARGNDTQRRLSMGRSEAVKHHLLRSGIAENRLSSTANAARKDSIADREEGPVIHVIIGDSVSSP